MPTVVQSVFRSLFWKFSTSIGHVSTSCFYGWFVSGSVGAAKNTQIHQNKPKPTEILLFMQNQSTISLLWRKSFNFVKRQELFSNFFSTSSFPLFLSYKVWLWTHWIKGKRRLLWTEKKKLTALHHLFPSVRNITTKNLFTENYSARGFCKVKCISIFSIAAVCLASHKVIYSCIICIILYVKAVFFKKI